jgi:hypothetical protein
MDRQNNIEFVFNISSEFMFYKINGDMILYTDPNNFIGKNIKDVLPENVASITTIMIDKCFETCEKQEYDYELSNQNFHSILIYVANLHHVLATITRK